MPPSIMQKTTKIFFVIWGEIMDFNKKKKIKYGRIHEDFPEVGW